MKKLFVSAVVVGSLLGSWVFASEVTIDFTKAKCITSLDSIVTKGITVNDGNYTVTWQFNYSTHRLDPIKIVEIVPPEKPEIPEACDNVLYRMFHKKTCAGWEESDKPPTKKKANGENCQRNEDCLSNYCDQVCKDEPEPDPGIKGELIVSQSKFILTGYDYESSLSNGRRFGPAKNAKFVITNSVSKKRVNITSMDYSKDDVFITQIRPGDFNVVGKTTKKKVGIYKTNIVLGTEGHKNKITIEITLKVIPYNYYPKLNTTVKTVPLGYNARLSVSPNQCKVFKFHCTGETQYKTAQVVCTSYHPWSIHAVVRLGAPPNFEDMKRAGQGQPHRKGVYSHVNAGSAGELIKICGVDKPTDIYVMIFNEAPYSTKTFISFCEI